jgi:hypothetical protein
VARVNPSVRRRQDSPNSAVSRSEDATIVPMLPTLVGAVAANNWNKRYCFGQAAGITWLTASRMAPAAESPRSCCWLA